MGDADEGTGDDAEAGEPDGDAGGRAWPARPIALAAGVIAGVVLIGGVALAARDGDPSPPSEAGAETEASERSRSTTTEPAETTTTTLVPTTTAAPEPPVTEAPPTTARPPRSVPPATQAPAPPPRSASCARPWPAPGGPLPTVFAPPGQFVAFGPPAASCVDVADGCQVSVTLRWTDGYTEVGSQVLAGPGQYTVNGDRGTNWTFTVTGDRVCISNGGNWSNVYPPGT